MLVVPNIHLFPIKEWTAQKSALMTFRLQLPGVHHNAVGSPPLAKADGHLGHRTAHVGYFGEAPKQHAPSNSDTSLAQHGGSKNCYTQY